MSAKKITKQNKKGGFADHLKREEVAFSKIAAKELEKCPWATKILEEPKVARAIQVEPNHNRDYSDLNEIKSALFEVRFAYNIFKLGLPGEYEYRCGIRNSSVDFKITKGNSTWLVELTSLRARNGDYVGSEHYCSISALKENAQEVMDIVKVQRAILSKILDEKGNQIKFPSIQSNVIHMILVDMRSPIGGMSDHYDGFNIAYGSKRLIAVDNGVYCRKWVDQNGKESLIKGLFDKCHPESGSSHVRERIHVLGFVLEKDYAENELIDKIKFFYNPQYFQQGAELPIFCNKTV